MKNLHTCCISNIPTVFDESLSYYEQVCKLTHKMNEIINAINNNLEQMIRIQLDKLFINAIYEEETETLILVLEMR